MPCCIKCRPNICHFLTKAFQRDRRAMQAKIDVFFCCKQTTTMIKKKLNVAMICINNMQIFYTTAQKLYPLITKAECFFPFPYHNSLPRKECHFNKFTLSEEVNEDGTRRQKNCCQIVFWVNSMLKSRGGKFFIFCLHPINVYEHGPKNP